LQCCTFTPMVKQVVFMGSKAIGHYCLQQLIQLQQAGQLNIIACYTQSHAALDGATNVAQLAQQYNIPVLTVLNDMPKCDLIYSVQYHAILKAHHIAQAKLALNLHMAPLPEFRGANQFSLALLDNKKIFGTTIHKMDSKIDNGDIAFEKRFPIPPNTWVQQLYELTYQASKQLFDETIHNILNNKIEFTPQAQLIADRGTTLHFKNEINTLKCIDHKWPAEKILQHIRATYMPGFEPPFMIIDGVKINCVPYTPIV
jgi:methionyl-tRNA formyltransferase